MAENTKIQWTDHTFNPWRGCTKVSPGCQHCYAETQAARNPKVLGVWGPQGTRPVASESYWRQPLKWNREAQVEGRRHRVFCASLADVFEDRPELAKPRERLLRLIANTPALDWQLLTKRPKNMRNPLFVLPSWLLEWPPHVWAMASIENQEYADHRIPELLKVPARIRGLSVEPLLGPVDLTEYLTEKPGFSVNTLVRFYRNPDGSPTTFNERGDGKLYDRVVKRPAPLHWVIIGGESGPHARPCRVEWIRDLVRQCQQAGVACFVKQLGSNFQGLTLEQSVRIFDPKVGDPEEWPEDLRVRQFPDTEV
jgi:protein gp37